MANKHRGSNFEDFLKEDGIFGECNAEAVKSVIAFQLEQELKKQKITKSQFAKKMKTSRSAVISFTKDELKKGLIQGFLEVSLEGKKQQVPLRDSFLTFALLQAELHQLL